MAILHKTLLDILSDYIGISRRKNRRRALIHAMEEFPSIFSKVQLSF